MAINCPNKNTPEWKKLVDILGGDEDKAMLVWHSNNGKIPLKPTTALDILNREVQLLKTAVLGQKQKKLNITAEDYKTPEGKLAGRSQRIFQRDRLKIQKAMGTSLGKFVNKLKTMFMSPSQPIRDMLAKNQGEDVLMAMDASMGASGIARRQVIEMNNQVIKALDGDMSLYNELGEFMQARRAIEIHNNKAKQAEQGMFPTVAEETRPKEFIKSPQSIEMYKAYLSTLEKQRPEDYAKLDIASEVIRQYKDAMIEESFTAGRIDKETRDYLINENPFYNPRLFLEYFDNYGKGKTGVISEGDSGIKALDEGSDSALIQNPIYLMGRLAQMHHVGMARNAAAKEFGKLMENPEIAKVFDAQFVPSEQTEQINGKTYIKYRDKGEMKQFILPTETAEFFKNIDPQISPMLANLFQWLSGTKPVKALATGYNPAFALSNTFVDMFYKYLRSPEYSWFLPKALYQQAKYMKAVAKDAWNLDGIFKKYIENGGSMDTLTSESMLGNIPTEAGMTPRGLWLGRIEKVLGKLGNTSELIGRLSHMKYLMEVKKMPERQAAIEAMRLINYRDGGTVVKALDNAMPYLNASVQASKGILQSAKANKGLMMLKIANLMALGYGTSVLSNLMRKDAWESVNDREKTNNLIYPLPYSYKDSQGRDRHIYIRVKLDQASRIFKQLGEEIANAQYGDPTGADTRISMAMSQLSPVDINMLMPPTLSALIGYASNKDFWKNQDIWKGAQVKPTAEYTAETPEAFKAVGEATGASPERLKYMTSRLIPVNPFTSLIGMSHDMFVGKDNEVNKTIQEKILAMPFVEKIIRSTSPYELKETEQKKAKKFGINIGDTTPIRTQEKIKEAEVELNTMRQKMNVETDKIVARVRSGSAPKDEFYTWLTQQGLKRPERKRLIKRFREKTR